MNRRLCLLHPKSEEELQKLNFGSCYYGCDLTALAILYNDSPEAVAYSALIDDSKPTVRMTQKRSIAKHISCRILINMTHLILNIQ